MGLFSKGGGGGDAVMGGDQYFFMDDESQQLAICKDAGGRMAQAIAGTVKVRDDGDEVHVTGHYGQFPVRIIIWVSFANLRIQVKPLSQLAVPTFASFRLEYDEEAAKHAGEQLDRDEWDEGGEQKLFLSPSVYMEGDKDELRQVKPLYDQLPQALTGQLLQLLESPNKGSNSCSITKDQVEVYLNSSDITLSYSAGQRIASIVHLLTSIAQAAATAWGPPKEEGVSVNLAQLAQAAQAAQPAQPAAPAGPPAGPPPGAPAGFAPGTPVLVTWSDGNRYGATVMQAAPGQVLVAFPNGQQQWVGLGYVAPAG